MLKPCIIRLGYVGLPLLLNLSKNYNVIGYDLNKQRILNLKKSIGTLSVQDLEVINSWLN